jgi:hypothetical protein
MGCEARLERLLSDPEVEGMSTFIQGRENEMAEQDLTR